MHNLVYSGNKILKVKLLSKNCLQIKQLHKNTVAKSKNFQCTLKQFEKSH